MSAKRIVIRTHGPEETRKVGRAIARSLPGAFALSLEGPLGSGKTVLAAGVCDGLGIDGPVTSPTYTLQNEYTGTGGRLVIHVDCFRLQGAGEFDDLGVFERMRPDSVLLVEWGDRALAALPSDVIRIQMLPGDESERRIVIRMPDGVDFPGLAPAEGV